MGTTGIENKSFFIVSCARSGSTSLATILNMADNAICEIEPTPNLNYETREMMEGRLKNPLEILEKTVIKRVKKGLTFHDIYGEKNVTYGPFIPYLYEKLKCKFVFIKRDGRDVIRSLMDWHNLIFGTIYRECTSRGNLSTRAIKYAGQLTIYFDTTDYSRPRPQPNSLFYDTWDNLSREEMCSFYWTHINKLYKRNLNSIPKKAWIEIDYTTPTIDDVFRVIDFLALTDINKDQVQKILNSKINSVKQRYNITESYPNWKNWDGGQRRRFDSIAKETMELLGYANTPYWKPKGYGHIWNNITNIVEWYKNMHHARSKIHEEFVKWIKLNWDDLNHIIEFGCGAGAYYPSLFANKHYVGIDMCSKNIEVCRKKSINHRHAFICEDVIEHDFSNSSDLVFSHGTIDNMYSANEFLKNMVKASKKWIYLTAYRGWFPNLMEHKYRWNEDHGCFYNDLSPKQMVSTLENLGCIDVVVKPIETGRKDIPHETLIMARRGDIK